MVGMSRRSRSGCLTCRVRHLRCDETEPVCDRCVIAGRDCAWGFNVRFVHGVRLARETANETWNGTADYRFDKQQPWIRLSGLKLSFVDDAQGASVGPPSPTEISKGLIVGPHEACPAVDLGNIASSHGRAASASSHHLTSTDHGSVAFQSPHLQRSADLSCYGSLGTPSNAETSGRSLLVAGAFSTPRSPGLSSSPWLGQTVHDANVAYLLQHYVESKARLLDVCDPQNHFGRVVPQLAATSPLILNAILAVSAHHLWRSLELESSFAEEAHERCVELLIPMLSDISNISDEVVAATVLLRNYEQMSSAVTGVDSERHLSGASAFMEARSHCISAGGLQQASFWIFVRQDLDVALSQQRPPRVDLDIYSEIMDSFAPEDDWTWANKIIWITAETAAFCFGWDRLRARYEELKRKAALWWESKPASFRPLFVGEGEPFPHVYHIQTWHALAMQYYHIVMILLLISDVTRQRFGFGQKDARSQLQERVSCHASMLFGRALTSIGNETKIVASNAVSICAPWIGSKSQQVRIVEMLEELERSVAWPTRTIVLSAMDEWEWSVEDRSIYSPNH